MPASANGLGLPQATTHHVTDQWYLLTRTTRVPNNHPKTKSRVHCIQRSSYPFSITEVAEQEFNRQSFYMLVDREDYEQIAKSISRSFSLRTKQSIYRSLHYCRQLVL